MEKMDEDVALLCDIDRQMGMSVKSMLSHESAAAHTIDHGSLALRQTHRPWTYCPMNYSRLVMNTGWSETRQNEPKDRDISKTCRRDLTLSTYKRIATITDGSLPATTYQDFTKQVFLKPYYEDQEYRKQLVNHSNFNSSKLDRDTGRPKTGYAAVLPQVPHLWREYMSTYVDHYRRPYPPLPNREADVPIDHHRAIRRMVSQFTDPDNHRRVGRNHWQDESGTYFNSHLKPFCPYYKLRLPPFNERPV